MAKEREKLKKVASKVRRSRYKNDGFLKILGKNCRRLRIQRGLSIDRMSKQSEQLSAASIDRLERGLADSQVLVLVRYAECLGLSILDLFSFIKDAPEFARDSRIIPYDAELRPLPDFVPVYPLKVAAGIFSNERSVEAQPIGWIDANLRSASQDYFACFVYGESMKPLIPDGALCLFRKYQGGSRQGKVLLVQARGLKGNDSNESFVIKRYSRQTPSRTESSDDPAVIHLLSENPRFSPIILVGLLDEDIQTIAEFIRVL